MQIEQAVFTSARTERSAGYQLVAVSRGVRQADARELSIWGPSHESLCDEDAAAESVNFHNLPSGAFCVSKTVVAGSEYSERGGQQIYTQCLVVPAAVLVRFSNNPFALLQAAEAQGSLQVHKKIPRTLVPIQLSGGATAVDERLLAWLAKEWGADRLATLVKAMLMHKHLGLAVGPRAPSLIMGLLNCFPVECRTRFSFSTGLKCSPRRPFCIVRLPDDNPAAVRRFQIKHRIAVWTPNEKTSEATAPHEGWPGLIGTLVRHGDVGFLAERLSQPRPGLALADLELLGKRLCAQIATSGRPSSDSKADEPLSDGRTTLSELINQLRRHPSNETTWNRWVRIHQESIARKDRQAAAELVFKACQIFGVQSKPKPRLVRRVVSLLEAQWDRDSQLFQLTLNRLHELKPVFGLTLWLQLAHQIAARGPGGDGAPNSAAGPIEIDDHTSRCPFDSLANGHPPSNPATGNLPADVGSIAPGRKEAEEKVRPLNKSSAASSLAAPTGREPSQSISPQCPQALAMLEMLDDTVYEAIAGKPHALETLKTLWPQVLAKLDEDMVEESKHQYLRHALGAWRECTDRQANRDPARAAILAEVTSLLMAD